MLTGCTRRGIYDEAYLDYLRKLLESMTEHGLVGYVVSLTPGPNDRAVARHSRLSV